MKTSVLQTVVMTQFFRVLGHTAPRQIIRRSTGHEADGRQAARGQCRIRQMTYNDREVVSFAEDIDVAIVQIEHDRDIRIAGHVLHDRRCDLTCPKEAG
ncbi:MAG: hypothetical protein WDN50_00580 [Bradyrhizobium sp.]